MDTAPLLCGLQRQCRLHMSCLRSLQSLRVMQLKLPG